MKKDLIIFKLDDSKATNQYINAIKKTDLSIDVVDKPTFDREELEGKYLASLVMKPYNANEHQKMTYSTLVCLLEDFNVELNGIQYPTINAIIKTVEEMESNKNVVVVGRSEELGIPLANELIRKDYIVTVVNSKNNYALINADIIINTAPIKRVAFSGLETIIDVSGTIKETNAKRVIKNIGRRTTEELENMVKQLRKDYNNNVL